VLDKLSRPLFKTTFTLSHAFSDFVHGFTLPYLGELRLSRKPATCIFSAEELASLLALPSAKDQARNLHTEPTAYLPAPAQPLDLHEEDRKRHLYLVGKTGMGKSTVLLQLFTQDCAAQRTLVLLDPHGDLIDDAARLTPPNRHKDLILLDPSNADFPLALNPLELLPGEKANLKSSALIEMFEVLAKGSWGPRLEYILRNALLLLILSPNTTLLDLPRLLTSAPFCLHLLDRCNDLELRRFFHDEFLALDEKTRHEHVAPILNKLGPLLTLPLLRNIFGQPQSKFSFETAFAQNKIILINLSKGKLGEDASAALGMIFISMIQSTLLRRAALPPNQRGAVALTIDEFQNFTTRTLLTMLAESRKYGLALTLANQYLTQLPPEIQDAVLGNAGSLLAFRSSYADAQILAPSLGLLEEDLTQLAPFQAYAKLLKNQNPLPLFRLDVQKPAPSTTPAPLQYSPQRFGRPRLQVEAKLQNRYNKK
jgi:DNA helicase HerA-like ATPase